MMTMLIITGFAVKLAHLLPIVCIWMTNIIAGCRHIKSNKVYKTEFFGEQKQKNRGEQVWGSRQVEDVFIPGGGSVSLLGRRSGAESG